MVTSVFECAPLVQHAVFNELLKCLNAEFFSDLVDI